jgi:hypothetical protein
MIHLEKKNPEVIYSPIRHSDVRGRGWSVYRGNIMRQAIKQEGLQRKEERKSQLQFWNVECKKLESRRQIGRFKKGNAEERGVCCRWQ